MLHDGAASALTRHFPCPASEIFFFLNLVLAWVSVERGEVLVGVSQLLLALVCCWFELASVEKDKRTKCSFFPFFLFTRQFVSLLRTKGTCLNTCQSPSRGKVVWVCFALLWL